MLATIGFIVVLALSIRGVVGFFNDIKKLKGK